LLVIAGEASADHHAAKIVRALRARAPDLELFGMGGPQMQAAGFNAVVDAAEMSVMGLVEVIKHLPRILGVFGRLEAAVRQKQPKVALLLDLPDFNLRMAKFLKRQGVHVIYYISPQLWAWRQGRVAKIRRLVDRMLCILPFEEEFYRQRQVPAQFVGHPLVEDLAALPDGLALRRELGLERAKMLGLLPGSRRQESERLLPELARAAALVAERHPDAQFVVPLAGTVERQRVEQALAPYPPLRGRVRLLDGRAQEVLAAADGAVVASGTATLEAALIGTPFVAVYKMSWLSFAILSRLVKVASVILANLILGRRVVDELLQGEVRPERIAGYLEGFIADGQARARAQAVRQELLQRLGREPATDVVVQALLAAQGH
jgi:lipid-A-disaccharide synthase